MPTGRVSSGLSPPHVLAASRDVRDFEIGTWDLGPVWTAAFTFHFSCGQSSVLTDCASIALIKTRSKFTMVLVKLIGTFIVVVSIFYIYYKYVIFNFWRKKNVFYPTPVIPTGNITAHMCRKNVFYPTSVIPTGNMLAAICAKGMFFTPHIRVVMFPVGITGVGIIRVFGIYMFFKLILVIADLDLIRVMLIKKFVSFHNRGLYINEKINPLFDNLVFINGKRWRNLSFKLTPTFTVGKIKQMFPIVKECSEELAKYLESKAEMRDSIEMKDILARFYTKCQPDTNNEHQRQGKNISKMKILRFILDMSMPEIMNFFSIPLIVDRHITSFYMQAYNVIRHDFMNLIIQLMERGFIDPDNDKTTTTDVTC
ncbi:hypothetical protein DBV15_09201 [Temnothorax longispinosus]|uniref:Uncharacterized protein n=1 Tax=Temnothorax longispinosus TaxID=300112 RepID=A0A4S2KFZ5_9HYME|nr:hypothetical protein DBV15_09201 [Temnothorax longispinosus]